MALQTSGPISLLDVQNEFGGSNPIGMNEYYGAASGVPTSGAIGLNAFYGKSAYTAFPSFSASLKNSITTVTSGKFTFHYVYWSGGQGVFPQVPIRVGGTVANNLDQSANSATDGRSNLFPNVFMMNQTQFNALPKTFLRTVEDDYYISHYYGVEPFDVGYSHISFKGETKQLRKATYNMTLNTAVHLPSGVAVCALYTKQYANWQYRISFLGQASAASLYVDAATVGMTFTQDLRGGTLTFVGV